MRGSERLRRELDNVLLIMKKLTGLPLIDFILSRESANKENVCQYKYRY